ncbi:hypothetical protein Glove_276g86 [Diversispora epigaea]|uniref:Protein kinase domain-containing protein n=1 Tax=Diversispora epigaea TaxID=1348612 RepID=A0A397IAY4_9GLOM|nr:hypothetical protein Glove_276g86 [Diversispora epigaea]
MRVKTIQRCPECNQEYFRGYWCKPCNSTRLKNEFDKWTSGNDTIDKFIQDSQLNNDDFHKLIEWIPFDRFQDIKEMAKGGFGTIYHAKWIAGPIRKWDAENQKWKRSDKSKQVALKKFDGIGDINEDFLNELAIHLRTMDINTNTYTFVPFYGITRDPETLKYMMVLKYLKDGNLRNHLNNNFNNIKWEKKLSYLKDLSFRFTKIHKLGIIHQDFHPGNILSSNFDYSDLHISDFGLSKSIEKNVENPQKRTVFGVLPYIAPEVLCGEEYTKAADVYSFAIITYEIITGLLPYPDVPHDEELALKICSGLPKIPFYTPKLIARIVMRCWDSRVTYRPTFDELEIELRGYFNDYLVKYLMHKNNNEIAMQIKEAEEFSKKQETPTTTKTPLDYKTHPQAIYTSRLLNFSNLPKPVNEPNFEKKLEEISGSISHIITNNDIGDF